MTLADSITAERETPHGPKCSVGRFLASVSKKDAADFLAAAASPMESTRIARALKKHYAGTDVRPPNYEPIQRHRKGDCRCEP